MPYPGLVAAMHYAWAEVTEPSQVLLAILENEDKARTLYNMVERQYKFISAERSDDDERGEMTTFDKVLIEMWHEEQQLQNIGLLEFFLEEYLMAKSVDTYAEKKALVFAYLEAGALIDAGLTQQDSALENLIRVYQEAKARVYYSDADKSGISNKETDKFSNVRFLRDTAENLCRHMKAHGHESHPLMPEVEKIVDISAKHAEHLAGGRKRVFEAPEDEDSRPVGHHWRRQRRESGRHSKRPRDSYRPDYESRRDRYEPDDRYDDRRHGRDDSRDRRDRHDKDSDEEDRRHERDDSRDRRRREH
ncbi:uncharacterized protein N7496_007165 [Penicillium cataractarum]|uniref:Uncharacterized protein n=1 Tax=Penicillium cataractarum TaxID=2100454 RepID=A0A9W9S2X9_9EURO|nr:uncharacterized protein N7496_007165 [Penicillium cataractarum]KAJ5371073.1 hypothetical protein N7496_007165 [Penicillium cataractarum]